VSHFPIDEHNFLSVVAILCAVAAAVLLVAYLIRRPSLEHRATKLWLLAGLGVLPIGSAMSANVQGYKATQHREFCGSCHVMTPHASDAIDPRSNSLSAIHARNPFFGKDNCYTCHADYGMFGTFFTKLGGMRHVWLYATEFRSMSLDQAREKIHLRKPYPNNNCMQCHTTTAPAWSKLPDHASARQDVLAERIGCSSRGCHGFAHPLTKVAP
jgi:nitrate/TMAO reductase-like tetraheme cytochrome c subunit